MTGGYNNDAHGANGLSKSAGKRRIKEKIERKYPSRNETIYTKSSSKDIRLLSRRGA